MNYVGPAAVWRSPAVQPTDLEVWDAVEWPTDLWAIPNNCLVCSACGAGVTALAGGDYDGDDVSVTFNGALCEFLRATELHVAKLDLARAETEVKGSIVKADPPAWNGPKRAETYLKHMLVVPTPNVRGQVTALAETVQDRFLLCDM